MVKNFHLSSEHSSTIQRLCESQKPNKTNYWAAVECLGGWMGGNKLFIASQSCTHSMQWASRELATPLVQLISIFYLQLVSWLLSCCNLSSVLMCYDNTPPSKTFNSKGQLTNKPIKFLSFQQFSIN